MPKLPYFSILLFAYSCLSIPFLQAQQDTLGYQLDSSIVISATRIPSSPLYTPIGCQVISIAVLQKGQQQLNLTEALDRAAGVFALNGENFAQDLRVSIRGFGARSAFGIRGIKVLVDGIPESTPDGTAQVDNVDPGMMQGMEVLRGPSAGLYGNASGGVIQFKSEDPSEQFAGSARITAGSFGLQRYQLKASQKIGKFGYVLYGAHTTYEGYRENSEVENNLLNAKLSYDFDPTTSLKVLINHLNSPRANDPGGINLAQAEESPETARDRNLSFQSGETVTQSRVALIFNKDFGNTQLNARAYSLGRSFSNKLPFEGGGIVTLNRSYNGGGIAYGGKTSVGYGSFDWKIGTDLDQQIDDRQRFDNLEGALGTQTLSQEERFSSWGTFGLGQWHFAKDWRLLFSLRYDRMLLEARDAFLADGDDSGEIEYNQFNPLIGLSYEWRPTQFVYANISTSFETPALSELSNNPDGGGGFNPGLDPQRARNIEFGLKGFIDSWLSYDAALFFIKVEDELVPFELEDFPGRNFFQNAGGSDRKGLELNLNARLAKNWQTALAYTYADFVYDPFILDGDDFSGNHLPGLAKNIANISLSYGGNDGFYVNGWLRMVGSLFANNSNSVEVDPYELLNIRAGYVYTKGKANITPFIGVNNLLDQAYFSNIRINAFGSRFYEPGPGRAIFGGISVGIN